MGTAYPVERVPMPPRPHWSRFPNPITVRLRALNVGESIVVPKDDPNWRAALVTNLCQTDKPKHWFVAPDPRGRRVFRDR